MCLAISTRVIDIWPDDQGGMTPDCPLGRKPFALSLSKGHSWFDKALLSEVEGLTTNGFTGDWPPNGQSGMKAAL